MLTPLHPMIVHFPIVMLLLGVFALWISFWKSDFYERSSTYLLIGGFIGLIAAFLSGNASIDYAKENLQATTDMINQHRMLGVLTIIVFALTLIGKFIHRRNPTSLKTAVLFTLSLLGLVVLIIAGHLGGAIVYQ